MLGNKEPREILGDLVSRAMAPRGCHNLYISPNALTLILIVVLATVSLQEICLIDGKMAA